MISAHTAVTAGHTHYCLAFNFGAAMVLCSLPQCPVVSPWSTLGHTTPGSHGAALVILRLALCCTIVQCGDAHRSVGSTRHGTVMTCAPQLPFLLPRDTNRAFPRSEHRPPLSRTGSAGYINLRQVRRGQSLADFHRDNNYLKSQITRKSQRWLLSW